MDTRAQGSQENPAIEKILAELDSQMLADLNQEARQARIQLLALNLVAESKKLDHQDAINVLMRANRHPLFAIEPAHQIILKGYRNEKFNRSPINTGIKTLAFIQAYQAQHQQEADDFLMNPERVLTWINQAPAIEVSKLFDFYFSFNDGQPSKYYENVRCLAEADIRNKILYKNFILLCLIYPDPLQQDTIYRCKYAMTKIYENEPEANHHIIQMVAVRVNPACQTIRNANDRFIRVSGASFADADFSNLHLCGAKFIGSSLVNASFDKTDLSYAQFNQANLVRATLHRAKASQANFSNAQMCHCKMTYTDLSETDFTGADLSGANLFRSNLAKSCFKDTSLNDVEFFDETTFDMVGIFKSELNYLDSMLFQHEYRHPLMVAIMNNLLKRIYTQSIPDDLLETILEAAYEHPLFGHHDEHHLLKSTTNLLSAGLSSASTIISTTVFGWFGKQHRDKTPPPSSTQACVPVYETRAQTRLREELQRIRQLHSPPPTRLLPN